MSNNLTLRYILLAKLNRVLNPNFDLKFTWTLLAAGLCLVGYQRVIQLAGNIEIIHRDIQLKLELSSGVDIFFILIGLSLILVSCLFFYKLKISKRPKTSNYKNLSDAAHDIRKLMDENRRIYISFGPNSSAGRTGDIRHDPSSWNDLRIKVICPNNEKIRIILRNIARFDSQEQKVVDKMMSHIEAFDHHCQNPIFDYSNNQFPVEFSNLILRYCAKTKKTDRIEIYTDWLREQTKQHNLFIEAAYIFGSVLYGEEKSDVDLLIKTGANSMEVIEKQAVLWAIISEAFSSEFHMRLHMVVFSNLECKAYSEFLTKIHEHEKVI